MTRRGRGAARRRTGWALAVLAGAGVACGASRESPPSFALIVVDALRADHWSAPGGSAGPALDALRARSVSFRNAYANAPWTVPSLASLFLSQLPSQHRVVVWGASIAEERVTVAELLRDAGYRTGAFVSNVLIGPSSGLAQGFDTYEVIVDPAARRHRPGELYPNASADRVSRRALTWIERVRSAAPEAPFLAYLHYMEPDSPYRCPGSVSAECDPEAADLNGRLLAEAWEFSEGERARIRALYRREVASLTRGLGRLLDALDRSAAGRALWVVVTADHGEQLGESGAYLHGRSLDQREIRVPLLVSGPSRTAAAVDEPVSLIDVAPTLLDLAGLAAPRSFLGRSLRPALEGRALAPVPVVSELFRTTDTPPRHRLAALGRDEKLVLASSGEVLRFDLARDPDGLSPRPATRRDLQRALGVHADRVALDAVAERPPLDAEVRGQLEALGYGWD